MNQPQRRRSLVNRIVLMGAALLVGCSNGPDLQPVSGKVQFRNGSPLTAGTVIAELQGGGERRSANGAIQPDGSFVLGTLAEDDGAVPGEYLVMVLPEALSEEQAARSPTPIDPRYSDPNASGLSITVERGKNVVVLEVSRPGE